MTCPQEEEHHLRIGSGTGQVLFGNRSAMRFASEDELLAAHTGPHYAVAEDQARGARSSVDVRPLGRLLAIQDMQVLRQEEETPQPGLLKNDRCT